MSGDNDRLIMTCEKCGEKVDATMSRICVSQEQLTLIKAALLDDKKFMDEVVEKMWNHPLPPYDPSFCSVHPIETK